MKAPKPPQFSHFFLAPRWHLFYHGGVDIGLCVCFMAWLNYLFQKFCHQLFLQLNIESFHSSPGDASKQNGYGVCKAVPPKKHPRVGLWPFTLIASTISMIINPKRHPCTSPFIGVFHPIYNWFLVLVPCFVEVSLDTPMSRLMPGRIGNQAYRRLANGENGKNIPISVEQWKRGPLVV